MSDNYKKYSVDYGSLAALCAKNNLQATAFSPFSDEPVKSKLAAGSGEPDIDPSHEKVLTTILQTVTAPDKKLVLRFGGGQTPLAEQVFCFKEGKIPCSIMSRKDEVHLYQYPDTRAITDLFIEKYSSKNEVVAPNLIPPFMDLDEFIFILFAIDMYRRKLYEGLLDYTPTRFPHFSANALVSSFMDMIKGKDIRWLTPCFLFMVPDFDFKQVDVSTNSLKGLIDTKLCVPIKLKDTDERGLEYTNEGLALGAEFERSWFTSIAFSLSKFDGTGVKVLEKGFIAPTAASNHFVTVQEENGKFTANHQAFMYNQLHKRFNEILDL